MNTNNIIQVPEEKLVPAYIACGVSKETLSSLSHREIFYRLRKYYSNIINTNEN